MLRSSAFVLLAALPLCLSPLAGCDSGPSEAEKKRMEEQAAAKQAEEDALAKRKAEREAEEAAVKAAAEEKLAKLDALAVIPEDAEKPKNAEAACQSVADAQDAMMQKYLPEDKVGKWDEGKSSQLQMAKAQCVKMGSMEVAMCQANALNSVPEDLYKDFNELIRICAEKYKDGGAVAEGEADEAAG